MKDDTQKDSAVADDAVLDLDSYVPFYLRAIANRLAQVASRHYNERFGIGLNEWSCLALLAMEDDVSATRISEVSGFDKAVISRSINSLESKGYVTTKGVKNHNKRRLIRLTPVGREVYSQIRRLALVRQELLLKGISATGRAALLKSLRLMHRNATMLVAEELDAELSSPS